MRCLQIPVPVQQKAMSVTKQQTPFNIGFVSLNQPLKWYMWKVSFNMFRLTNIKLVKGTLSRLNACLPTPMRSFKKIFSIHSLTSNRIEITSTVQHTIYCDTEILTLFLKTNPPFCVAYCSIYWHHSPWTSQPRVHQEKPTDIIPLYHVMHGTTQRVK